MRAEINPEFINNIDNRKESSFTGDDDRKSVSSFNEETFFQYDESAAINLRKSEIMPVVHSMSLAHHTKIKHDLDVQSSMRLS